MNYETRLSASKLASKKLATAYTRPIDAEGEADLVFAILEKAILDLSYAESPMFNEKGGITVEYQNYQSAYKYLFERNEIAGAELIGLDSAYIKDVINKCLRHYNLTVTRNNR